MAGGYWETQNKVRPGAYINFKTNDIAGAGVDAAGPVAIPLALDWGESGKLTKVSPNTSFRELFGKNLSELKPIREAFKATADVLVFNLSGEGTKATATGTDFTAEAVYGGDDGNKLTVVVSIGLDGGATVTTYFDSEVVSAQTVTNASELENNAYVTFSGNLPVEDVTLTLTGGATVPASNDAYANFSAALDSVNFKTVAIGTDDESVKALFTAKVKHWRANEGKNVTFVTNDYADADHEGVVSVKNGVFLDGNVFLSAADAVYWYAAAYANAGTSSLTYTEYPGAVDCERLSHEDIVAALTAGHIVFSFQAGLDGIDRIVVEQDINTFRSFTASKNQDFRKNKILRSMDIAGDNIRHIFSTTFIGKVDNSENGRDLFKSRIMQVVLDPLVQGGAIEAYKASDITILPGAEKDAVVAAVGLKFVDAMEKLYLTVNCQ